jgi:hypothetical protein
MAISVSGSAENFGYYTNGTLITYPFTTNIADLTQTSLGWYGGFLILTLPPNLSYWQNVVTLNLDGNLFQTWSDFSDLSVLETFSAASMVSFGGTYYVTNLNGLVLPPSVKTISFDNSPDLNDYLDTFSQGLFSIGSFTIGGCALDATNVNNQVAALYNTVTSPSYIGTPGTIDLSAGTNAAPSGAAIGQIADLINNYGWAITTN